VDYHRAPAKDVDCPTERKDGAMSERDDYPAGVPCWVENLQDDVERAKRFYGALFGWDWDGPGPMAGDSSVPYFVARLHGAEVAGVAPAPDGVSPAWMTQVSVASVADTARATHRAGGTVLAAPMDLPPVGRLAVLADPAGAVLCAFEPAARRGAQRINEPGAWAMSLLVTPDPVAAAEYYGAVFGWRTEPAGPFTLFRLPGYVGGEPEQPVPRDVVAAMVPEEGGARPVWAVDFWISDADAAVRTAREHGGQVLEDVHDAPPFRRAVLSDPGGASFSVSQLVSGQLDQPGNSL
jgi:uncharacterized protein